MLGLSTVWHVPHTCPPLFLRLLYFNVTLIGSSHWSVVLNLVYYLLGPLAEAHLGFLSPYGSVPYQ